MIHSIGYYSQGDSRVRIQFCRKCSKEGLQLALEPDCPGEIPKINDQSLDKEKQAK